MRSVKRAIIFWFAVVIIGIVFISDTSAAWFTDSADFAYNFSSGDDFGGSNLQDGLDLIVADILNNNVLAGAGTNYQQKDSWAAKIYDYLSGGSEVTNFYGFSNPYSLSERVIQSDSLNIPEEQWNPMIFITNDKTLAHDSVASQPNYSRLYGSLVIYKPNGNSPVQYYVVEADGGLGNLNTFNLP